jgi:hypothetical protein
MDLETFDTITARWAPRTTRIAVAYEVAVSGGGLVQDGVGRFLTGARLPRPPFEPTR